MGTQTTNPLECVEIESGPEPEGSVIWLHGLGADGHDFEPVVPALEFSTPLRYVFPHAPVRPVTINGGMPMRAWYDVLSLDRGAPQDEAGIRDSARLLEQLIEAEISRGSPPERIILAGFSQGGAIALHTAVRYPQTLAGVLALSTYLPLADTVEAEAHPANHGMRIFMAHGEMDSMLPLELGERSCRRLEALGYAADWKAYPMDHAVCPPEVVDIRNWLAQRFP